MGNCVNNCNPCCNNTNGGSRYAFILVLFILLVICGAAFWFQLGMNLYEFSKLIKQVSEVLYSFPKISVGNVYPQMFDKGSKRKEVNEHYKNIVKSFLFRKW